MAIRQIWRIRWLFLGKYCLLETEIEEYYREMMVDLESRDGVVIQFSGPVNQEVS